MKTKKTLFTLALALVLMVICALPVMAAAETVPDEGTVQVEVEADDADLGHDPNAPVENSSTELEIPAVLEGESVEENYDEIAPQEVQPVQRKSSNTPYLVGAGIAVLLFIGVALYCRANGNK